MRTRLVLTVLATTVLVLATACGGGSSDTAKDGGSGGGSGAVTTTAAGSGGGGSSGSSGGGSTSGDKVDCAAVKHAAVSLISVQLLAQIRDPEAVASLKDGTIGNLDLDAFLGDMKTLHALDSVSSPLGDPKAAIGAYEAAATKAKALFAADPPAQADIDAYNASIGSTAEFLGHQSAIAGAMDAAGC